MENNEILGNLEEIGLSKYESSAYYNLLGKGMITATEISYCSNLPRQKIYSVLKKLEAKKLVLINYQKPLMCRAIPPKEAFKEIVIKYEIKLNDIKKIISNLQQINDEGLRNKGIEEKKYFILNQCSTTNTLADNIKKSKESIYAMVNPWGSKLLAYFKNDIVKAIINGVRVRLIFDGKCEVDNRIFPNTIEQKISKITTNIFIFDNINILILDKDGIRSTLVHSNEMLSSMILNQFNDLWDEQKNRILELNA
jgi:sugar-specific transcriptional regulator TrmB